MKGFWRFCRLSYCYCCSLSDTLCQTDGWVGVGGNQQKGGWDVKTPGSRPAGSEQTRAGQGQRRSSRSTNGHRDCAHAAVPKLPDRGQSGANPPPPFTTQDHISVFWCLLFVTEGQMNPPIPPSSQDRPACRLCCHCCSIFFFSYIVSFFFFFCITRRGCRRCGYC